MCFFKIKNKGTVAPPHPFLPGNPVQKLLGGIR